MIEPGDPHRLGATPGGDGVNFAVYAPDAEAVQLCLFDDRGVQTFCHRLPEQQEGVWHGFVPRLAAGHRYGFRAHGRYAPWEGLHFNPSKLLIDPYARVLDGELHWAPAVYAHDAQADDSGWQPNPLDSAPFVPKCVVTAPRTIQTRRPSVPWRDSVIYEANVRGYTMRCPGLRDDERGRLRGLANGRIVEYLKALGITAIELLPVHAFADEAFLHARGLRNFWGYNTLNFFSLANRYCGADGIGEFHEMVNALHDAGIEVILDVVYNHTAEGDEHGPTLSFRGLANLAYYRTLPGNPGTSINDTGCGNTVNASHPVTRRLIVDSLRYWVRDMGVDGFRFDLAPVLGRHADGFDTGHPLLTEISNDPELEHTKLIVEPWDVGPGGYQLGAFPARWSEWNDRYRDTVRRFWRGDDGRTPAFARRLHGSADIFEPSGRGPRASINFVTSHDGYTLADLVSYEQRHNEANKENNEDGHRHNFSRNYGVEGPTSDEAITTIRRQQRLNLLATLLLSQGTPMLLAGDEFGNSQRGNNNAYAQDNEIGWLNWAGLDEDPAFVEAVRSLIRLRRESPLIGQANYLHGESQTADGHRSIEWLNAAGDRMQTGDWHHAKVFTLALFNTAASPAPGTELAIAITFNAHDQPVEFTLPRVAGGGAWQRAFASVPTQFSEDSLRVMNTARSIACFRLFA